MKRKQSSAPLLWPPQSEEEITSRMPGPHVRPKPLTEEEARAVRARWEIPDWRDGSKYKKATEGLSLDQWRWEFLRRDSRYRRSWERRSGKEEIDRINAGGFDLPEFIDPATPAHKLKKPLTYLRAHEGSRLPRARYSLGDEQRNRKHELLHYRKILSDENLAVFVFTITKHIDDQVEHARHELNKLQDDYKESIEAQLRKNKSRMPRRGSSTDVPIIIGKRGFSPNKLNYLRVLDARNEKIAFAEIGKVVFRVGDYSRYRLLEELMLPESKKSNYKKRLVKYLQLPGTKARFYFPPFLKWWKIARDTDVEIFLVEGEKKAASLCKLGFPAIGLGGIWNWLTKNDRGPSDLIGDFNLIDWKNRKTTIVFDADV